MGTIATKHAVLAEGLVRTFGNVRAVDGVSLAISPGEVYAFLGPNGAGKTTLVRMLTTLLLPTAGSAWVAGYDVRHDPHQVRLRVGVALQEAALDNKQTGRELLRLQGRLYGIFGKVLERRIEEMADLIDIGEAMDRQIGTYSGGMKRRLDLATIAAYNPVTYLLEAMRSLISVGWDSAPLLKGVFAVAGVGMVSISLALAALRGRARRR